MLSSRKALRVQGFATDRAAMEAALVSTCAQDSEARVGTEEHGEWPQELTGRQNSGHNG